MKASAHKFVSIEQGATVKELLAALRAIVKQEGKDALQWRAFLLNDAPDGSGGGLTTGLPAQFPDQRGADDVNARVWIGFKREQ